MSIDDSAFGRRESDAFPITAPLKPIRPNDQDCQMMPRPRGSSSRSGDGLVTGMGQEDDRSSAKQVSTALPIHIRKPIGLLLGSLLVKDLSTCISTCRAGAPFLPSMLVSRKMCNGEHTETVMTNVADGKRNRFDLPLPKGDRLQAPANGNDPSDHPSHLKANNTDNRDETIKHIEFCDRQLDALDRKARSLSIKTNWTYWHLAKAYEAFCVVSPVPTMSLVSPSARQYIHSLPPLPMSSCDLTMLSAKSKLMLSFDI